MNHPVSTVVIILIIIQSVVLQAQEKSGLKLVEQLLVAEKVDEANKELQSQVEFFKSENNLDTLSQFPYSIGKVEIARTDQTKAVQRVEAFIDDLKASGATSRQLYEAYMNVVPFFDEAGLPQRSYDITLVALGYAEKMANKTEREVGYVEYNLGASQLTLGDFDKAESHFRRALNKYLNHPEMPPTKLSDAYNAMGAMMWLSSKLDSATYFYGKAVSALDDLKDDPVNKAYLSAIVQANIGLINLSQGNTNDAIKYIKQSIDNYQVTLNESDDESLKVKASKYQWRSMANLATIFNEMGDFQTTHNLLTYVYRQHVKELQPNDPEIPHSKMKVAQSYLNLHEYEKSIAIINEVLDTYQNIDGDHLYWQATSYFTIAKAHDMLNQTEEAENAYNLAETFFEKALNGEYDREFLSFLTYKAEFFAKTGNALKAIETAQKSYDLALNINGENSLMAFRHGTTMANVHYTLGNYSEAISWSDQNFEKLEGSTEKAEMQDSLMMEFGKPGAILVRAKSKFQLEQNKDEGFLKDILNELESTIPILERRKSVNNSAQNLNLLIAENSDLFEFMKQVNLELYNKTKEQAYLDKLLSLHESSLYSRIRARLNNRNTGFSGVPEEVIAEENAIRSRISEALSEDAQASHLERVESYFKATEDWERFMASIKKDYPKYYNMRFQSIVVPLDDIHSKIPESTTIVRYFFVNQNLLALVLSSDKKEIFQLDFESIEGHISSVAENQSDIDKLSPLLLDLYQHLWEPLAQSINTEQVIIIPDKALFNISFGMLTHEKVNTFSEFEDKSLLTRHAITYDYSMLLLDRNGDLGNFEGNYIAFAPGFFDNMKDDYKAGLTDSLNLDEVYLGLLPQPFTRDLATSMKRLFKGTAFFNEKSTEATFKSNANLHKIIHIGTHAESDNLSPELSRLVFAKDHNNLNQEEDNYLYAWEVYNCDLKSNLTLLTACETGKPGYQPGEGMISMAHAFNYAGSESIMTGLWKIDEKASTDITGRFYKYLSEGKDKGVALQQAKLDYIRNANGRIQSPEYWAGLVLLGDTSAINIEKRTPIWYWIAGTGALLLGFLLLRRRQLKTYS
ncbi:MAG: CHAT domain-containing protein [Bacteroidota bacterium]